MSQSRDSRFSISASRDTSNDTTTTTTVTGNNMSIFGDTRGKNEEENEQVVLISSAASGIGRGIAVAFAALNYRLVLVDENLESLSETSRLCREKYAKTATTGKSRVSLFLCLLSILLYLDLSRSICLKANGRDSFYIYLNVVALLT